MLTELDSTVWFEQRTSLSATTLAFDQMHTISQPLDSALDGLQRPLRAVPD